MGKLILLSILCLFVTSGDLSLIPKGESSKKASIETLDGQDSTKWPQRSNTVSHPDILQENHCTEIPQTTGTKDCPFICTAKLNDSGIALVKFPFILEKQILVSKCCHEKNQFCAQVVMIPNGTCENITNSQICLDQQNLTIINGGEKNECYYRIENRMEEECLALVNPTPPDLPLSSTELPLSIATSHVVTKTPVSGKREDRIVILSVILLLPVLLIIIIMKKRRWNESSSSKWRVKFKSIGLLQHPLCGATPEDFSETATISNHNNLNNNLEVPV